MNMDKTEDPKMQEAAQPAGDETAGAGVDPDQAGAVSGTPSAGALLAQARDRMGLSVGEVANHLKLSIRQVEALEADAFERLPSPMFIRGFARSYARLVQVDPGPVMQALDLRFPPPPAGAVAPAAVAAGLVRQPAPSAIPFPSSDQPSRWLHSVAGLLAAVVVGFLAFEWFGPATAPDAPVPGAAREPSAEVVQSGMVPQQPSVPGAAGEGPAAAPGSDATIPAAASPADAAVPAVPPATPAPVGASSTAPSEIGDAFGTGPRTVRLSFDRESWVEIRDARGRLIFSQLNPPGSSQVVQGEPPLSLVVGNARSVRLAYGDRDIDLAPHTRVDVARFTLD